MVDIANIPDPLSPEERKKLKEERRLKIQGKSEAEDRKTNTNKMSKAVLSQASESMKREGQLDRIEYKLDRILEILEQK